MLLYSTGKVLTIAFTGGSDIGIISEDFGVAAQTGGTVKDQDGNAMASDSGVSDPIGAFGGAI